jgi:hypothetical protein
MIFFEQKKKKICKRKIKNKERGIKEKKIKGTGLRMITKMNVFLVRIFFKNRR